MWINPLIVYAVTIPSNHMMINTAAIVCNTGFYLCCRVRHDPKHFWSQSHTGIDQSTSLCNAAQPPSGVMHETVP